MQNNPVYRNHDGSIVTIVPPVIDDDLGKIIKKLCQIILITNKAERIARLINLPERK